MTTLPTYEQTLAAFWAHTCETEDTLCHCRFTYACPGCGVVVTVDGETLNGSHPIVCATCLVNGPQHEVAIPAPQHSTPHQRRVLRQMCRALNKGQGLVHPQGAGKTENSISPAALLVYRKLGLAGKSVTVLGDLVFPAKAYGKIYRMQRAADGDALAFVVLGERTRPLRHISHASPTGFNWGYGGSGPADLALAILADFFGETPAPDGRDKCQCWQWVQPFKWHFIASQSAASFDLPAHEIARWLAIQVLDEAARNATADPDGAGGDAP